MFKTIRNFVLLVGALAFLWRMLMRVRAVEEAARAAERTSAAPDAGQPESPVTTDPDTAPVPPVTGGGDVEASPRPSDATPAAAKAEPEVTVVTHEAAGPAGDPVAALTVPDAPPAPAGDAASDEPCLAAPVCVPWVEPPPAADAPPAAVDPANVAEARALLDGLDRTLAGADPSPVGGTAVAVATPPVEAPAHRAPAHEQGTTPAPAARGSVVRGSFSVSGVADGARQVVMALVDLPGAVTVAPVAWVSGGAASPPNTLVIDVDHAENCDAREVGVVLVPGYAPTAQGFTVRVVAAGPGPFTVSGRFRIRPL